MSFLSFHFIVFITVVATCNWLLRSRPGPRKSFLLLASYYFYAAWDWRFASLLLLLTGVCFLAGRCIAAAKSDRGRNLWLFFALAYGLGTLAFFKYAGFFVDEFAHLWTRWSGAVLEPGTLHIVLPLGISFFTFQSLSYILDVYRRQQEPCRSLRDFALFAAFFPTVLAGPITRARQLLPQFQDAAAPRADQMGMGIALFARGVVKKIFFADVLAMHIVNPAFDNPAGFASLFLLVALYAYTFQIYMDVSAYTDMARGVASLCGFDLPRNFDRPYVADSISNFWQRWHISMSSFFRDYLYFGLGGSKNGNVYFNLMVTFVAIGIWHGAGWNFVLYGLIHGGVVCCERWLRERRKARGLPAAGDSGVAWLVRVVITFHIVVFSRVLFRAPDLEQAASYMHAMLFSSAAAFPWDIQAVAALLLAASLHWFFPRVGPASLAWFPRLPVPVQAGALLCLTYVAMALSIGTAPFVYFKF